VELQRCGFSGLADAPSDVYGTILADAFEPSLAVAGLEDVGAGERYRIEQNYFKLHACCRFNHFALDAVLALRRAHAFAADDVVRLRVTTIPFGARMADPGPTSPLAAKFSIPYAVAAALVLDRTDRAAFEPPALSDPRIRELARRVEICTDPKMSPRRIDYPTAHVRIALRDGRILEDTTTVVRGDAANPVDADELVAKFLGLAAPVLGTARARRVVDQVCAVEALPNIRALTALLTPE
jgi:2-methylcitrate dehydratase PrpD